MKKIIASVLVTVMILAALATMAIIPASAASTDEGDWAVYASAGAYLTDGEGNLDYTSVPDAPLAGYEYTEEGLVVTGEASSKFGTTQRFNVMSKEVQNLKKGITMTVVVNEMLEGEDWWHSFCIWDSPNLAQGDQSGKYGNGYLNLIRGNAAKEKVGGTRENPIYEYKFEGAWTQLQSFICDQTYYDKTGTVTLTASSPTLPMKWGIIDFGATAGNAITDPDKAPVVNEDGSYTLTMKLEWDGQNYRLFFCGVEVTPQVAIDAYLKERFPDGLAYVGYALHGNLSDCTAKVTITEYNGKVPTGTDSQEFQPNSEEVGKIIPGSEVPDDQPVLYFDAANVDGIYKNTGMLSNAGVRYGVKKDGSFWLRPETAETNNFIVAPRNPYSYEASEFPYVAILFRNFCTCELNEDNPTCYETETLSMYYCAGDTLNPTESYLISHQWVSSLYYDNYGNTYTLFIFDLTPEGDWEIEEGWSGRINKVEFVFHGIKTGTDREQFDMVYSAFFKSADAAYNYAENYAAEYEMCLHNEEDLEILPAVEESCDSLGWTEGLLCTACGEILVVQQPIGALGHDYQPSEAVAPTCTEAGREAGMTCTRCGEFEGDTIEATGHTESYEEKDGGHIKICVVCGKKWDTVEEHTLNENNVCTVCGAGCPHKNTTKTEMTAPTCVADGQNEIKCDDCGYMVGVEAIPKLGHDNTVEIPAVAPDCVNTGLTQGFRCSREGCTYVGTKQEVVPALGHDIEITPAVEATCKSVGYTEGQTCKRENCPVEGKVIVAITETPMAAHTYDDEKDADCNVCGAKRTIPTEAPSKQPTEDNKNDNKEENNSGKEEEKKGCGSAIGLGAFAIIASVAVAGAVSFKKKED